MLMQYSTWRKKKKEEDLLHNLLSWLSTCNYIGHCMKYEPISCVLQKFYDFNLEIVYSTSLIEFLWGYFLWLLLANIAQSVAGLRTKCWKI